MNYLIQLKMLDIKVKILIHQENQLINNDIVILNFELKLTNLLRALLFEKSIFFHQN